VSENEARKSFDSGTWMSLHLRITEIYRISENIYCGTVHIYVYGDSAALK